jgi:hypothetical protein
MDHKQLVTIAITAVISVIAKEVVVWLLSFAKNLSTSKTVTQTAKKIFHPSNWGIMVDFSCLLLWLFIFRTVMRGPNPPYRGDVLDIVVSFIAVVFYVVRFVIVLLVRWNERQKDKANPSQPLSA